MSKRPRRRKHVPQRTCVVCRTARPKRELVRIVRLSSPGAEGTVVVDETGKRSGRGAYLCRQQVCWKTALTQRQLERALKVTIMTTSVESDHNDRNRSRVTGVRSWAAATSNSGARGR